MNIKILSLFPLYLIFFITNAQINNKEINIEPIKISGPNQYKSSKKENPAYQILREVWKRKKNYSLEKTNNYKYREYEKIELGLNNIDHSFLNKKIFQDLNISKQDIDTLKSLGKTYIPIFINESITDVIQQNNPEKKKKDFLRASIGLGRPDDEKFPNTIRNIYKDIDIYDNFLNILNKGFTSPLSTIGFSVYEYSLVDTVNLNGVLCYHIKYNPLRTYELTFQGDLYINSNNYTVKQVNLKSDENININFLKNFYIELEYKTLHDSLIIPTRNYTILDMSLLSKNEDSKGIFAQRTVAYDNYQFNQPEEEIKKLLDQKWEPLLEGAYAKDLKFWQANRPRPLQKSDIKAYQMLGKIARTEKFKNITKTLQIVSSGYVNVKKMIDVGDFYKAIGVNNVEGFRLRAAARTHFSPNDMWRVEAYTAYGFKDGQFKYGSEFRYLLDKYNRLTIGGGTKRDISQMGTLLNENDGILNRSSGSSSIISRGDNDFLSSLNQTNIFLSVEPWKNLQIKVDGNYQYIKSANLDKFNIGYYDNKGNVEQDLYDTHLTFSIEFRPGAKYSNYGIDRSKLSTLSPTFILKYIKGFNGVLNSTFNYDKLQFLYNHPILLGPIGKTNITLELGKSFSPLPLSLLSVISGNQSYKIIPNTFALLNYYDFVTDEYSTLHIEHHFGGRIFSYIPLLKKLKLREVVFVRGAWGDISKGSKEINASNINYIAPYKDIYYEYGFGIENIGIGNLRIFRVDFNWRGNYFNMPDADKFGIKAGVSFGF